MTLSQKFKLSWGFLLCEVKKKGANLLNLKTIHCLLLKILLLGVIPGPITIFMQQIDQETVSYSRISSIWNHLFLGRKNELFCFLLLVLSLFKELQTKFWPSQRKKISEGCCPLTSSPLLPILRLSFSWPWTMVFLSLLLLSSLRRFLYPTFTLQNSHFLLKNPNINHLFCINLLKT